MSGRPWVTANEIQTLSRVRLSLIFVQRLSIRHALVAVYHMPVHSLSKSNDYPEHVQREELWFLII